jgi:hypothetical protein
MEALEKQNIIKEAVIETTVLSSSTKSHNPGLRALLAIKNFTATLEKDYTELLRLESELDELNKKALLMIESNTSVEALAKWKEGLQEVNYAITGINTTLTAAKEQLDQETKVGYPELWKQLSIHVSALKDKSKHIASIGIDILPEAIHAQWEHEFVKLETELVESIVTHVDSCRVLLQMIERYTPAELNTITQIIAEQIPLDFTYQEALEYQNDYYKALVNFKKEFKEEKNLWDKFLDILAGGTHQAPSERVMMERWLDGDKGDL